MTAMEAKRREASVRLWIIDQIMNLIQHERQGEKEREGDRKG